MEDRKIRVAITHGDTNGIGYELIFKTFAEPEMLELCTPIIYGSPKVAAYHRKALDMQANFSIINNAEDVRDGRVNMLACFDDEVKVEMGTPTRESGLAALRALDRAMTDFRSGLFDVLVACPVNDATTSSDDYSYRNLKDYLETSVGEGCKGLKIMINETLRIATVTDGLDIKDVAANITHESVAAKIKAIDESMRRDFRLSNPRVAVLALNHDNNRQEEREAIAPAIDEMAASGVNAFGAYQPDDFFARELFNHFDCTLAMYDDQAAIAFNTLMQQAGVTLVTGLPLVCTAPALTPCFEAAGKGIADECALRHAIFCAIDVFRHRNEYDEPLANPLPKLYHERRDESDKVRFSIPKKRDTPMRDNRDTAARPDRKPANGNAPQRHHNAKPQPNGNEQPAEKAEPAANKHTEAHEAAALAQDGNA